MPTASRRSGWCCCAAPTSAASCFTPTTTAARRASSPRIRTPRCAFTGIRSRNRSASKAAVERLPNDESDAYFASRPRGSQLGAWVSDQSAVLPSRESLEERYRETERQFEGQTVPRPPFWGGFRLVPSRIEFWFGRPDRLHDRLLYVREGDAWRIERLYP